MSRSLILRLMQTWNPCWHIPPSPRRETLAPRLAQLLLPIAAAFAIAAPTPQSCDRVPPKGRKDAHARPATNALRPHVDAFRAYGVYVRADRHGESDALARAARGLRTGLEHDRSGREPLFRHRQRESLRRRHRDVAANRRDAAGTVAMRRRRLLREARGHLPDDSPALLRAGAAVAGR